MTDSPDARRTLAAVGSLLQVIARLRAPDGCPWDREQTTVSMGPHLLEEAHEAADAVRRGDDAETVEELGDVLMNVLMIAQIASEEARFGAADVAQAISDKLVRRHPHVFGDVVAEDASTVLANWEAIKRREKGEKPRGTLDGVPVSLPGLLRAFRVGEKAARVGFDWPDAQGPRAKIDEELAELDEALASGDQDAAAAELGDLLFAVCNLARHHGIEPESAIRGTVDRFTARFQRVEAELGDRLGSTGIDALEEAWERAKRDLAAGPGDGSPPGRPRRAAPRGRG
ncbi:MAG: nucleoside triphosphate pyrophosphohydrolase [Planctomycetota bacterium]